MNSLLTKERRTMLYNVLCAIGKFFFTTDGCFFKKLYYHKGQKIRVILLTYGYLGEFKIIHFIKHALNISLTKRHD